MCDEDEKSYDESEDCATVIGTSHTTAMTPYSGATGCGSGGVAGGMAAHKGGLSTGRRGSWRGNGLFFLVCFLFLVELF